MVYRIAGRYWGSFDITRFFRRIRTIWIACSIYINNFNIWNTIKTFLIKQIFFSSKYLILLIILTCPILIFLLSGNKPQIFFSGLVFLALCLSFVKLGNSNQIIKNYSLINILICVSVMGKFSFGLSGFLVWIISTIKIIYKKKF